VSSFLDFLFYYSDLHVCFLPAPFSFYYFGSIV
jgi:hypothetical protein